MFDLNSLLASAWQDNASILSCALSFAAGLLSALSPCVYPLIPITLSVIGARRYDSRMNGFLVASFYVFGMALVYTVLGISFASLGFLSGSLMQQPIVLWMIAALFVLFSLITFGLFTIVLPPALLNKLSALGQNGFRGAFLMGLVAGLIAAPCTGPVLAFILTIIAKEQDILSGVLLMSSYSLGMGLPFLILGTFSSFLIHLPKSGPWMDTIKRVMATFMLSAAVYYASLAQPTLKKFILVFHELGFVVLGFNIVLGLVLLTARPSFTHNKFSLFAPKIIGISLLCISVSALLIQSPPIKHESLEKLAWHIIDHNSQADEFDVLLRLAKERQQKVIIDFYADWCVACIQLSNTTLKDKTVQTILKDYFLIKVDASRSSSITSSIQQRYNVVGLPTLIVLDQAGVLSLSGTIIGYVDASQLSKRLSEVAP